MKKFLVILILVVGNFLIVGTSYSYSAVGYMKCETVNKLVAEDNADVKNMIMFWFSGYYTGRNYETSSYPAIPDPQLIYIATMNYCNNNPLQDTVDLADHLYSSLI
ncbi:MAG: hypothetical protein OSA79_04055 [Candidatus Thioglobus sp.]|jgi:hypothetical protein|nr:hypothetical protein [Candidatus Thioglobus sp.]